MHQADPIVVLGSRVTNGQPGALLVSRLNETLKLAARMPDSKVLVSGSGEAAVMASYLIKHGLDPARIVQEPEATSTNENLENCFALVENPVMLHVVTNEFHSIRTRLWAWHLKIPIKLHVALTPTKYRLRNYSRELLATPHSAARIVWRKLCARF